MSLSGRPENRYNKGVMSTPHKHRHFLILGFIERATAMPYHSLFGLWIFIVLCFSQAYLYLSLFTAEQGILAIRQTGTILEQIGNSIYFSVITATTVGYGDMIPSGFSKFFAALEAVLGFALFALFISKIVSENQETALRNIHRLAFHNAFTSTREGFYILRRDCDQIVTEIETRKSLSERSENNLIIIFRKGQVLFESMIDFYDDFDWYDLDERREALLLESVSRTLQRMNEMLHVLRTAHIIPGSVVTQEMAAFTVFAHDTLTKIETRVSDTNRPVSREVHALLHQLRA